MKIKICGNKDPNNIQALLPLKPDFMGFIFYKPSQRYIGNIDNSFFKDIPPSVRKVGVFVNEEINSLIVHSKTLGLDYVQLHGEEDVEYVKMVYFTGVPVIKVFRIDEELPCEEIKKYESYVSYFLFDKKTEKYGGSGKKFPWSLLDTYVSHVPFIVSGGIGPDDAEALKQIKHPKIYAADINSCFETKPGIKNVEAITDFIKKIRYAI
mgnify:CR=1 FL=1